MDFTRGHFGLPADLPSFCRWLAVLLLCLVGTGPARADAKASFRGLWVVRHSLARPDDIAGIVRRAKEAGFNALMVQVRGRGDAYYASDLVPPGEDIEGPAGFDPLREVIEAAHAEGLEVHAWFNALLTWYQPERIPASERHVFREHPEWFMESVDGLRMGSSTLDPLSLADRGVEGRYLSVALPEVRDHLLDVIHELVRRYPVDGLHLDYIRYPNRHYDFHPMVRAEFTRLHHTDPRRLETTRHAEGNLDRAWRMWRADKISTFVSDVRVLLDRVRPGLKFSAAVKPDLFDAYALYGQDWARWLNHGWMDFAVPMFYVGGSDQLEEKMREVRLYVRKGHLYAGVGAWNQSDQETVAQIRAAERSGLEGTVVFSYETLLEQARLGRLLREGPFRNPATTPRMWWKEEGREPQTQTR